MMSKINDLLKILEPDSLLLDLITNKDEMIQKKKILEEINKELQFISDDDDCIIIG